MRSLYILYHMVRADFLERARRYSFLIMLGLIVYLGFAVNTGLIVLRLDDYRGVFNSAWVGSMMTMVANFFLGWFGFYLVKNSVARDDQTGVGQIIATTPVRRPLYTAGKWLSNFAVLLVLVGIMAASGVVFQLIQREDPQLNLAALLAPFVFVALPMMGLVAAAAVLFETIGWLRGGFGNVVYFFLYLFLVPLVVLGKSVRALDPLGMGLFMNEMGAAAKAAYPAYEGGFSLGIMLPQQLQTFYWPGVRWTPAMILIRLGVLALAAGMALVAALFFDRFDPSRERMRVRRVENGEARDETEPSVPPWTPAPVRAPSLAPVVPGFHFHNILMAELRLMLKGLPWWWYAVALILIPIGLLTPVEAVRQVVLPITWIWPVLVWSAMGSREARYATGPIVFSAARPLLRQLTATWMAGVLVTALTGIGAGLRLLAGGDGVGAVMWAAGVLFIPSLALAMGVWSGSGKLFEVCYTLLWYLGPLNRVPALDYVGASGSPRPDIYLAVTLLLLVAAALGRRRQLQT